MATAWDDAEHLLLDAADQDLARIGSVTPALLACAGSGLRMIAWLRPFAEGAYHDPLVEVLSLALGLDCDRLMLLSGARLHPLEGEEQGDRYSATPRTPHTQHAPSTPHTQHAPSTPHTQHAPSTPRTPSTPSVRPAVLLHAVDAAAAPPRVRTVLWHVDRDAEPPRRGQREELAGGADSWIGRALWCTATATGLTGARRPRHDPGAVVAQARRVVRLGHDLYVPPDVHLQLLQAASRDPC